MIKYLLLLTLPISSLFAAGKKTYLYETRVLLAAKASLKIEVQDTVYKGRPVKFIRSNSFAYLFGKEIYNLDYMAYSKKDLTPITNIECEIQKNLPATERNCKQIQFLEHQQFVYKRLRLAKTSLPELTMNDSEAQLFDITEQQPDFDQSRDRIYDLASLALTVEHLNLTKQNPSKIFYIAVNKTIGKVQVSLVKNISRNLQWIKITPIRPSAAEFDTPFPHKIIYDTKLKVVTEVHQKAPVVGNIVIKLNKRKSSF